MSKDIFEPKTILSSCGKYKISRSSYSGYVYIWYNEKSLVVKLSNGMYQIVEPLMIFTTYSQAYEYIRNN